MVEYDVTFPFIRMVAGPLDYTQGAMVNMNKENFRVIYTQPMSQGTRCRQLAEYVIFESPVNMMCDNPTNYLKEEECTKFIASLPTVWDETRPLQAKIGEYIVLARKNGNDWYVGALTDWTERDITIDLSFLPDGKYKAEFFRDGVNADRVASDYKREVVDLPANKQLKAHLAPGGGYIVRVTPVE
jgi:alpha-glucosidase